MPIDPEPLLSEQDDIIFVVEADEVVRSALHFILDDQNETHSFASLDLAFAKSAEVSPYLVILGIDLLQKTPKPPWRRSRGECPAPES